MHQYTKQLFDVNGELISTSTDILPQQSQVNDLYRELVDKHTKPDIRILANNRYGWSFTIVALFEQGDVSRTLVYTCTTL